MKSHDAQGIVKNTIAQYDKIAEEFDRKRAVSDDCTPMTQYVKQGDMVLDACCGNGRLADVMRGHGVRMIGCDGSVELVHIARQKYVNDIAEGWLGFTVANLLELPFDECVFDVVFLLAALHHIPSKKMRIEALRTLRTIIKKDGTFIGTVWNLRSYAFIKRYNLSYELQHPKKGIDKGDVFIPWRGLKSVEMRYCHAFSIDELRESLTAAGWRIETLHPVSRIGVIQSLQEGLNLFWVARAS